MALVQTSNLVISNADNFQKYADYKKNRILNSLLGVKEVLDFYNVDGKKLSIGLTKELDRKIDRVAKKTFKDLHKLQDYRAFSNEPFESVFQKYEALVARIEKVTSDELVANLPKRLTTLSPKRWQRKLDQMAVRFSVSEYRLSQRNQHARKQMIFNNLLGYSFVSPAIVIISIFIIYSIGFAIFASLNVLKIEKAGLAWEFVGFDQYSKVVSDPTFVESLRISTIYMAMVAPIQTVLALILSSVLSSKIKGNKIYLVLFFLPTLTSSTALTLIFVRLFGSGGPMEQILGPNFTTKHILGLIAIMNIWSTVPLFITTFNAGHAEIPKSLYEAAAIDGASVRRRFFLVTVPQLRPIIFYVLLIGVIGTMQMFDQAFIITKDPSIGANPEDFKTTAKYIYDKSFATLGGDFGYGSAAAIIFGSVILGLSILSTVINRIGQRRGR